MSLSLCRCFGVVLMSLSLQVFGVVLMQIRRMRANRPAGISGGLLRDLKGVASLTLLLGLTWTFGFLTWGSARVPLLYLFSALNSLQGPSLPPPILPEPGREGVGTRNKLCCKGSGQRGGVRPAMLRTYAATSVRTLWKSVIVCSASEEHSTPVWLLYFGRSALVFL